MGALLAFVAAGLLTSCSIDQVKFSAPSDAPTTDAMPDAKPDAMPDSMPVRREICETVGDEDGNGKADCEDTACVAGVATCTATAACFADCAISRCGDNRLNPLALEEVDPPVSLSTTVPVNPQTCRYDFSAMTQLYCAGTCGTWGGGGGCQQQDADAFCKLKTGNATAVAGMGMYTVGTTTATPGICCPPNPVGCKLLGPLATRGITVDVAIHDTDMRSTHGGGQMITNPTCVIP